MSAGARRVRVRTEWPRGSAGLQCRAPAVVISSPQIPSSALRPHNLDLSPWRHHRSAFEKGLDTLSCYNDWDRDCHHTGHHFVRPATPWATLRRSKRPARSSHVMMPDVLIIQYRRRMQSVDFQMSHTRQQHRSASAMVV